MEEALIEMKKRNDELVRGNNKDSIDSPTSPKFYSTNDQVMHLKEELKRREAAHTERIVEMVRTPCSSSKCSIVKKQIYDPLSFPSRSLSLLKVFFFYNFHLLVCLFSFQLLHANIINRR